MKDESTVTPIETEDISTVEETENPTEAPSEDINSEPDGETPESEESTDSTDSNQIEDLKREINQLKSLIRQKNNDREENGDDEISIPKDVKEFLSQFADNPQETLEKVINKATLPYKKILTDLQQQNAIDYIRSQKDFSDKMYDDILYIIEGADRNRWFNYGNTSFQLKDLPPRQKAEAALQILRERNGQKIKTSTNKLKPVTTAKSQATKKSSEKPDSMLTADEFAAKYGIKQGAI